MRRFSISLSSLVIALCVYTLNPTPVAADLQACDPEGGEGAWEQACQNKYPNAEICSASCEEGLSGEHWLGCVYVYEGYGECPPD